MPITQERLHQTALAGDRYRYAFEQITGKITELIKTKNIDPTEMLLDLASELNGLQLTLFAASSVLDKELVTYKLTLKNNIRKKEHMARARSASGSKAKPPDAKPKDPPVDFGELDETTRREIDLEVERITDEIDFEMFDELDGLSREP